jgi:hypothetical protein
VSARETQNCNSRKLAVPSFTGLAKAVDVFRFSRLATIRDGDDATILDAASADGASDADSPT